MFDIVYCTVMNIFKVKGQKSSQSVTLEFPIHGIESTEILTSTVKLVKNVVPRCTGQWTKVFTLFQFSLCISYKTTFFSWTLVVVIVW
jgi:hypothetical protein